MFLLKAIATSLFIGMLFSWSGGSIFSPIYNVAAPIVCSDKFVIETEEFRPRPGEVDSVTTISCDNLNSGKSTDITLNTIIVAGLIYSALVFVPVLVIGIRRQRLEAAQNAARSSSDAASEGADWSELKAMNKADDPAEKLRKLKELNDSGLITEQEYQAKRSEIISKM